MNGKVKKVVPDRGFGFIKGLDGRDYFFHISGLSGISIDSIKDGDNLVFDATEGKKGARAENVRRS